MTNGKPEIVISDDHVIQVHNGVQLIMRLFTQDGFKDMPYYVLKDGE